MKNKVILSTLFTGMFCFNTSNAINESLTVSVINQAKSYLPQFIKKMTTEAVVENAIETSTNVAEKASEASTTVFEEVVQFANTYKTVAIEKIYTAAAIATSLSNDAQSWIITNPKKAMALGVSAFVVTYLVYKAWTISNNDEEESIA